MFDYIPEKENVYLSNTSRRAGCDTRSMLSGVQTTNSNRWNYEQLNELWLLFKCYRQSIPLRIIYKTGFGTK